MAKKIAPMHPGEVLREEFLFPLNLSAGALAEACDLPRRIAAETTGITTDTALRLGKALGTSAQLWMNLQWKSPSARPARSSTRSSRSSPTQRPEP